MSNDTKTDSDVTTTVSVPNIRVDDLDRIRPSARVAAERAGQPSEKISEAAVVRFAVKYAAEHLTK